MPSPLKEMPITPTDENIKLGLAELQKLGWIEAWWTQDSFYVIRHVSDSTVLKGPEQVAIWIDGFLAAKGGLG